jgi:hypothetical protein
MVTKIIFLLCITFAASAHADDRTLVMGYKDEAKPPLIGGAFDNSGLYLDLFTRAASQIGFELVVVRLPKKRLYQDLKAGDVDFYPGASFSELRAQYLDFLENGLQTKEVIVSRAMEKDLKGLSSLNGRLITDVGGSKDRIDHRYPDITLFPVSSLSFKQALNLIQLERADFYIADIEEVQHYLFEKGIDNFRGLGLKVHFDALGGIQPMYMGFSRKSRWYSGAANPEFAPENPLSYTNLPIVAERETALLSDCTKR